MHGKRLGHRGGCESVNSGRPSGLAVPASHPPDARLGAADLGPKEARLISLMSLITLALEATRTAISGLTVASAWSWDDALEELAG